MYCKAFWAGVFKVRVKCCFHHPSLALFETSDLWHQLQGYNSPRRNTLLWKEVAETLISCSSCFYLALPPQIWFERPMNPIYSPPFKQKAHESQLLGLCWRFCGLLEFVIIDDEYLQCKEWQRKISSTSIRLITCKCLEVLTCVNNL